MIRIVLSVALLVTGYMLICAYFYFQQRSMLYFPVPARGSLETIDVPTDLDGIRASVANPSAPHALVYFGGNAEDVSITAEELADRFPDAAIYALHYRGYGESSGSPSESALVADASALLSLVQQNHDSVRVVGRSLGSGVAIQASVGQPVAGMALVTPFASIREIGSRAFPFLPVSLLIKDAFDSADYTNRLACPVIVIIAEHDAVIPRWSTDDLVDSFQDPGQVQVSILHGRGHNDVQLDPQYWALVYGSPQ